MSDAFSYKRGMRLPARIVTLAGNGVANLTQLDAGSIKFVYRAKGSDTRNEIVAAITDAAKLQVEVDFGSVDTSVVGQYEWQVEAKIAGLAMSFPEHGFHTFSIEPTIEVT